MNKYVVSINRFMEFQVEVEAEDENEAIIKAEDNTDKWERIGFPEDENVFSVEKI